MEAIDTYRRQFGSAPDSLTNPVLAGTLLNPLGLIGHRPRFHADPTERRIDLGVLPIARRDVERLQQMFSLIPRMMDLQAPPRAQRGLLQRASLPEALTWLDIHGDRPDVVTHWEDLLAQRHEEGAHHHDAAADAGRPIDFQRPRRRRRRRGRDVRLRRIELTG